MYTWFYSARAKELYRYNQGVFEAYAAHALQPGLTPTAPKYFYTHHHLKVPPDNTVCADVEVSDVEINLVKVHPPCEIWREVTDMKNIKTIILQRKKRTYNKRQLKTAGYTTQ